MISRKPSLTPVTDSVSSEQYRRKYTVPRLYLGCTCRLYLGCDSLHLHLYCIGSAYYRGRLPEVRATTGG